MRARDAIAMLDRQIAQHGQEVTVSGPSASKTVKAFVRGYKSDELVEGVEQGDTMVALSPTGLDGYVPRRDDSCTIGGRARWITMADPIYFGDTLVRINLAVRG